MSSGLKCITVSCARPVLPGKKFCSLHMDSGVTQGLDADIRQKFAAKWDPAKAASAQKWLEELTKTRLVGPLEQSLKSGVVLCNAINAIRPGLIKSINMQDSPFKHRENIESYLKGCKALGVAETDLFVTTNLYEATNMVQVVDNLLALAGIVQRFPDYRGPIVGPRRAEFADKKIDLDDGIRVDLIIKNPEVNVANRRPGHASGIAPSSASSSSSTVSSYSAPKPAATVASAKPAVVASSSSSSSSYSAPKASATTYSSSAAVGSKAGGEGDDRVYYGLDADIQQKFAAKQDVGLEQRARRWLEMLTGTKLNGPLQESLKSGVILCQAINVIKPGLVRNVNISDAPFKQRENIESYLKACKALGMNETDLFPTMYLYEGTNMVVVVDNIFALGGLVQNMTGYRGPQLGPRRMELADKKITSDGFQDALNRDQKSLTRLVDLHGSSSSASSFSIAAPAAPVARPVPPPAPVARPVPPAAPAAAPAAGAGPKFCGNCGTPRPGTAARFCGECGAPF